jgi:GntR family negative regulator for fad regulon and positive regulator of fabA
VPQRPALRAESRLVEALVGGAYPAGATLPAERTLALRLGVTRPTLREALQRLERDGWLEIRQGKGTRVRDFWREGGLSVLGSLARHSQALPAGFVEHLLEVRRDLAPAWASAAVAQDPESVLAQLAGASQLADTAAAYARFDWQTHQTLTVASGNPIYTLILNGFAGFYEQLALGYFRPRQARAASRGFYATLAAAARAGDAARAARVTRKAMLESLALWARAEARSHKR